MGITDELRKYAQDWRETPNLMDDLDAGDIDGLLGDLEHIADRIDAEHERAMADAELAAAPTEAQLEEWGYVKLPVDAEGKPIRIGDVMEWCDSGETLTVEGIGRDVLFYIDGENAEWTAARNKRHHHEPTVEDVLRECCHKYHSLLIDDMNDAINGVERDYIAPDEIIAEYAAKLRLADDGKEQQP